MSWPEAESTPSAVEPVRVKVKLELSTSVTTTPEEKRVPTLASSGKLGVSGWERVGGSLRSRTRIVATPSTNNAAVELSVARTATSMVGMQVFDAGGHWAARRVSKSRDPPGAKANTPVLGSSSNVAGAAGPKV